MVEQPHFDDELTVLTARPVVPLEQIDATVKKRRRWFLGGAFVVAMLLGAASAVISAYLRFRNAPDPEIPVSAVSSMSVLPVIEVEEQPALEEQPAPQPKRPTPSMRNRDYTNHPIREPRLSEKEELQRIRDAVLVEEWQERRARRVERRERRRAERAGRDLSRVNEIFEGPRNP